MSRVGFLATNINVDNTIEQFPPRLGEEKQACRAAAESSVLMQSLAIATGGAAGALLRFWVSAGVYNLLGRGFPYGTLVVNVLGSLLMGFLYVLMIDKLSLGPGWRAALLVGLLGAFTTFSTFSIETLNLVEEGELVKAMLNIVLSVILCLVAAWVGVLGGRSL